MSENSLKFDLLNEVNRLSEENKKLKKQKKLLLNTLGTFIFKYEHQENFTENLEKLKDIYLTHNIVLDEEEQAEITTRKCYKCKEEINIEEAYLIYDKEYCKICGPEVQKELSKK